MALVVVSDQTRQAYRLSGSTIWYTPCGWGEYQELRRRVRDEKTLRTDELEITRRVLEAHVVAWENVVDPDGKPVPFTLAAFWHLSPIIIQSLEIAICSAVVKEDGEQKNLNGSSST